VVRTWRRAQIDRLAQRIESLAGANTQSVFAPIEQWHVEYGMAQNPDTGEEISEAELEERPVSVVLHPLQPFGRIVRVYVHADNGRPAACCQPGGACLRTNSRKS